jgi:hypothetical protein
MALVRCSYCGKEFKMMHQHIKTKKSCGCVKIQPKPPCKVKIGERYNNLVVLYIVAPSKESKQQSRIAICKCDCGNETKVRVDRLRTGVTTSCGCMRGYRHRKKNKIYKENDYTIIETTKGDKIKVDNDDIDKLSNFCWSISSGRSKEVHTRMDSKLVSMHRFLMHYPTCLVDHINHDTLDNRKCNLRLATKQQNNQNRICTKGTSHYKGVYRKYKGWAAQICKTHLGTFKTEEDAARAYNKKARQLFGEFACLNVIGGYDE